ncbi:hypothetical protein TWF730_008449 [Orbilia blumenaviensis]|uniref:Uncharacterized protein n=1 Tax=Orbilia blumenaviensis TaxID=1796055 RepID=A0AAV9V337_9PEZI
MATTNKFASTSGTELSLHPSVTIEETLSDNPFMTAAAGQAYTKELPSTWGKIPRIATTAFTVPQASSSSGSHGNHGSGYDDFTGSNSSKAKSASSFTSLDLLSPAAVPAPMLPTKAKSDFIPRNDGSFWGGATRAPNPGSSISQRLPYGYMSQQISSDPAAYLLKHNSSDSGILLTPGGEMKPLHHAQKQAYFNVPHPFPSPVAYYDNSNPGLMNIISYSQPPMPCFGPLFNPIEGVTNRIPLFKDEIFPTFDMGYYPDILHLPSRPSDILVYFNSICGAAALPPNRKSWIEDNMQETVLRFSTLDDIVFEMCDAQSGKPLRGPDEAAARYLSSENFKVVPNKNSFADWDLEIQECRVHLERLNKLAYVPVMNKSKVEVVWKALVSYRDNWANSIFSQCQYDFWEASMNEVECMKEYHAFNREMQRLLRGVEEDLIEVGRLENMVTAFRGAVWKAEMKLRKLKETFGLISGLQV